MVRIGLEAFSVASGWHSAIAVSNHTRVLYPRHRQFAKPSRSQQVAILLHELVHYYADSFFPTPDITLHRQEHYLVNDCVRLDAPTALTNPNSYVYYIFSKRYFLLDMSLQEILDLPFLLLFSNL